MRLHDLLEILDGLAPLGRAESWDNVGMLVGYGRPKVESLLLTIDLTPAVLDEAKRAGIDLVVAYHPVIFTPLKRLTPGDIVYDAIAAGIGVYCPHTALDVADGGTNDTLAEVLGLTERIPLRPLASEPARGMGRIGLLPPTPRPVLFDRIKAGLGVEHLLVTGPLEGDVTKAAVGAGACGDLLDEALNLGAQLYLTGELRHHDALRAAKAGLTVVCALHSNSERAVLERLAAAFESLAPALKVKVSEIDVDPFVVR